MNEKNKEQSLQEVLDFLFEWKKIIALSTFTFFVLGMIYVWLVAPVYKSDALLQVEEKQSGLGNAVGDLASFFEVASQAETEIELLKSRMVLGQVVRNMNLDVVISPKYFPLIGKSIARRYNSSFEVSESYFGLNQYAWGGEDVVISHFSMPSILSGETFVLKKTGDSSYVLETTEGNELLSGVIGKKAQLKKNDKMLELFVQKFHANIGTIFYINKIRERKVINGLKARLQISETGKKTGIIYLGFLHPSSDKGFNILQEIIDTYVKQNIDRRSEDAAKTLTFLNQQLPELRKKLEKSENAMNNYRLRAGSIDITQESRLVLDQSVTLEAQYENLKQKRTELLVLFNKKHPSVTAINKNLKSIQKKIDGLNDQVQSLPETQQDVLRLSRNVEVNNALYTSMLNNAQQLQVMKAGEIGSVRIVDNADKVSKPVSPKKNLLRILFIFVGFLIGVGIGFVKKFLQPGELDLQMIEEKTSLPIFATIPHSKNQEKLYKSIETKTCGSHLLANVYDKDFAVESFKSLQTVLHFGVMNSEDNSILFTGPSPGIGKSFVSCNFACSIVKAGMKVLLIDADMRKGHLHQYLGMERESGLSEYLSGNTPLSDLAKKTEIEGLDFVPTGVLPTNPSELLMRKEFTELLAYANGIYDYVLIDAPPILIGADSIIIAKHTATNILLLKHGKHHINEITTAINRIKHSGGVIQGMVINDVAVEGQSRSKYHYQYAYGEK